MRTPILSAVVIVAALMIVNTMGYDDEVRAESDYCAAVADWKKTGGHAGHPDYDGIAGEACREKK